MLSHFLGALGLRLNHPALVGRSRVGPGLGLRVLVCRAPGPGRRHRRSNVSVLSSPPANRKSETIVPFRWP